MFTVSSGFIGNFKLGDNVNHNLKILRYLYARMADPCDADSIVLRKPAIVWMASICEAILYDLNGRINDFNREGVRSIPVKVIEYLRSKRIDKFEKYIASARKHSLLGPIEDEIYDNLEVLRKLRNRVHIQNEKRQFEPDDMKAFNADRQRLSERTLERLMKILAAQYPRPSHVSGHVSDFVLPWSPHYPETTQP